MTQVKRVQRRYPRVPSQWDLSVCPAHEKKGIPMVSLVGDVGLGGCRFLSNQPWGENALLWLTMIPKRSIVEARARVVYERPKKDGTYEIGVEFVEISPRDKATLEKLLSPATPQPVS